VVAGDEGEIGTCGDAVEADGAAEILFLPGVAGQAVGNEVGTEVIAASEEVSIEKDDAGIAAALGERGAGGGEGAGVVAGVNAAVAGDDDPAAVAVGGGGEGGVAEGPGGPGDAVVERAVVGAAGAESD